MKLLEPFAGVRLASGHPVFHFAFFVGSFFVTLPTDDEYNKTHFVHAFKYLRYSHVAVSFAMFTSDYLKGSTYFKMQIANSAEEDQI